VLCEEGNCRSGYSVISIYGLKKENKVALQPAEMRMVRWMRDVKVEDKVASKELRDRTGIDDTRMWANAQRDGRPVEYK